MSWLFVLELESGRIKPKHLPHFVSSNFDFWDLSFTHRVLQVISPVALERGHGVKAPQGFHNP